MATIEGKRLITITTTKAVAAAGNYAAEDVISNSASAGTVWTFDTIAKVNGGTGYIVKAQVICETTAQVQRLTLYLFNSSSVTCAVNDNVANTAVVHADKAYYLGKIDFPAMEDLGGDSETVATPSTTGNLPLAFNCATADDAIYGVLVTRDAFTNETATDDYTIVLTVEQY
jgi:hypothetical protein